jgi:hypothetical protein
MDSIRLLSGLDGNREELFAESAAFVFEVAEVSFIYASTALLASHFI